jgi:hypothetical protein
VNLDRCADRPGSTTRRAAGHSMAFFLGVGIGPIVIAEQVCRTVKAMHNIEGELVSTVSAKGPAEHSLAN